MSTNICICLNRREKRRVFLTSRQKSTWLRPYVLAEGMRQTRDLVRLLTAKIGRRTSARPSWFHSRRQNSVPWRRIGKSGGPVRPKAVFDLIESRFSFTVNPDLDSLTHRMAWIRGCCRKWRHCYLFTFVMLLFTSGFASESTSKLLDSPPDSRIRFRVRALNGRIHRL